MLPMSTKSSAIRNAQPHVGATRIDSKASLGATMTLRTVASPWLCEGGFLQVVRAKVGSFVEAGGFRPP